MQPQGLLSPRDLRRSKRKTTQHSQLWKWWLDDLFVLVALIVTLLACSQDKRWNEENKCSFPVDNGLIIRLGSDLIYYWVPQTKDEISWDEMTTVTPLCSNKSIGHLSFPDMKHLQDPSGFCHEGINLTIHWFIYYWSWTSGFSFIEHRCLTSPQPHSFLWEARPLSLHLN